MQVEPDLAEVLERQRVTAVEVGAPHLRRCGVDVVRERGEQRTGVRLTVEVVVAANRLVLGNGLVERLRVDLIGALDLEHVEGNAGQRGRLEQQARREAARLLRLQRRIGRRDQRDRAVAVRLSAAARRRVAARAAHWIGRVRESRQPTGAVFGGIRRAEPFRVRRAERELVPGPELDPKLRRRRVLAVHVPVAAYRGRQLD